MPPQPTPLLFRHQLAARALLCCTKSPGQNVRIPIDSGERRLLHQRGLVQSEKAHTGEYFLCQQTEGLVSPMWASCSLSAHNSASRCICILPRYYEIATFFFSFFCLGYFSFHIEGNSPCLITSHARVSGIRQASSHGFLLLAAFSRA